MTHHDADDPAMADSLLRLRILEAVALVAAVTRGRSLPRALPAGVVCGLGGPALEDMIMRELAELLKVGLLATALGYLAVLIVIVLHALQNGRGPL